jgi:hypothetical protein
LIPPWSIIRTREPAQKACPQPLVTGGTPSVPARYAFSSERKSRPWFNADSPCPRGHLREEQIPRHRLLQPLLGGCLLPHDLALRSIRSKPLTSSTTKVLRDDAVACRDRLRRADVRVLGTVLNGFRSAHSGAGKRYHYYETYAYAEEAESGSAA